MKKVIFLAAMCLMALTLNAQRCTEEYNESSHGGEFSGAYIDLGLSSGTKWKSANERNDADAEYFFNYDEALLQFGDKLPCREQFVELSNECEWMWTGSGYKVIGPNGNYIYMPAAGYRNCLDNVFEWGSLGYYWSSTPDGSGIAWCLFFNSRSVNTIQHSRCSGFSVRLVQN